jgi:hypothetical protein
MLQLVELVPRHFMQGYDAKSKGGSLAAVSVNPGGHLSS